MSGPSRPPPNWARSHRLRKAVWNAFNRLGATGLHGLPLHRSWLDLHRRPMPLRGLHPHLAGLRLVQLSDLHYSPVVWKSYVEQTLDLVNELEPDLVVITGDLITGGYRYARRVAQLLRRLKAPRGVVVTFGNHDYSMWGKRSPTQAQRRGDYLERTIEDEGIIVLRNEVFRVPPHPPGTPGFQYHRDQPPPPNSDGSLTLVGLDDEWTGKIDPPLAFRGITSAEPVVCLNHNPVNAPDLLDFPWQWMLSGHTHGRQVGHKGLSRLFLRKHFRHFTHGHYHLGPDRHLYVNRGLSYGQRALHWCRPEVTVFRLAVATATEEGNEAMRQ